MMKFLKQLKCFCGFHKWNKELLGCPEPNTTIIHVYEVHICEHCGKKRVKYLKGGKYGRIRKSLG
ncbi:MAG: hypothetical protein KatS3mg002_0436 [Candidatus Woesearchaeota archaeon]|nr:MAG: hypothetical protein KatS3mg002_0436 [Candidatus Woesearchaeota archaeon]